MFVSLWFAAAAATRPSISIRSPEPCFGRPMLAQSKSAASRKPQPSRAD